MTQPSDWGSNEPLAPFHEVRVGCDRPEDIRGSFEKNGYLLFKGALNRETVLRARSDIAGVLQRQGVMQEDSVEPRATPGASAVEVDFGPLYRLKSPWELMASRELQEAVDIAFGERVRVGRSIGFRYSMPTDAPYLTPPHQDHFYLPADLGNEEWGTNSPPSYSSSRQTMPMSSQYQRTPSRMDMP